MRTYLYVIYWMNRIAQFDPYTDMLLTPDDPVEFLSWREPDQDTPRGRPVSIAHLSSRWGVFNLQLLQPLSVHDDAVRKWLHDQLRGRKSLGPWACTDSRGLFAQLTEFGDLYTNITRYNMLVANEEKGIIPPRNTHDGSGVLELAEDGQVKSFSVEIGAYKDGMWDLHFRRSLLRTYKTIQDERLGIA